MLAPTVSIAKRQTRVLLQNEGPPVADGRGGFSTSWVDLPPPADARVSTGAETEHLAAGASLTGSATLTVTLPYRTGVSTSTRVLVNGRVLYVTGVLDPDERHVDLVLTCEERR
jgi:SPP1 family predicted phage head-tail adaptor